MRSTWAGRFLRRVALGSLVLVGVCVPPADAPDLAAPTFSVQRIAADPVAAPLPTAGALPPAPPPPSCPADMAPAFGTYCESLEVTCARKRPDARGCDEYAASTCIGATRPMRFCIDLYEYPNVKGKTPLVLQSYEDAERTCARLEKRVCTSSEWTFACEGEERLPYPYGYVRDKTACNIDKPWIAPNDAALWSAFQKRELARLGGREPSGARPGCRSPFGVYDLTGSVDEWTTNETGRPFAGALKGGNWGPYRNACRPATLEHAPQFRYYQTGFRCCADAR